MKKIEVLSVPFYEFRCDPALMDEIQPLVESMNFEQKPSGVGISKDFFYHKTLFEWFNDCLEDVRKIYYIDSIRLVITNCWATRTNFASKHSRHVHHNAMVGGILYFSDAECGKTRFIEKNPWLRHTYDQFFVTGDQDKSPFNQLSTLITPERGKLILYPSHLEHETTANLEKKFRYVLAFDAFFTGRILHNAEWPYCEITSTSVEDVYNKMNGLANENN